MNEKMSYVLISLHWIFSYFCAFNKKPPMRLWVTILFFFLASLNGCVTPSSSMGNAPSRTENDVFVDEMETNLMDFYSAAAATRHAVQQETAVSLSGFSARVLPNRTRTVSNVNIRQVLLSTNKPAVSRLIHHSVNQLVAFPKEYHVFQLRRILI